MQQFDFDVAVIGGGSGGYAATRTAVAAGLKTVVIEGGEEVGGLCILRGCMPTKALLYMAEVAHMVRHSAPFGVRARQVGLDFKKAMARKNLIIKDFVDCRVQQLNSGKFKFIRANAKFLDPHTLELTSFPAKGKKPSTLTAKHFVIATGSVIAPSPLSELNDLGCLNSDSALSLKKLPKSLIVLGGGPTASEFAQFFARFGVRVTMIQRSPHMLHDFDVEASVVAETVFRREGIRLYTGTKLLDAKRKGKRKTVFFEHNGRRVSASAEEILFALGRVPNTASLGLENAGVKTTCNGTVIANKFMQTSAPHIYTAGDCTGPYEIVHIAIHQGEVAARNIANPKSTRTDYRLIILVVFTDPQLAYVGLTEQVAVAKGIPYLTASYPFNDHGKSIVMNAMDGFVKLLANPRTGEIIGGQCAGPMGGDLIHEIVAAMAKRMTVHELAAMPHYHPTLAEIWTYPAEELAEKIGGVEALKRAIEPEAQSIVTRRGASRS
ncbi:MAG TPA: NAD(P)/FAD-dependent oxidoreductase [Verrucomicrobiae bacterium]|nr:NAD(P)/FAD-dependent oxidoreductase [Verrucomicrobiae bacterium]